MEPRKAVAVTAQQSSRDSPHQGNDSPSANVFNPNQDDAIGDEDTCERTVQRSGTLNQLEQGLRHTRQDFRVRSGLNYATSIRQAFSWSSRSKPERPPLYTLAQAFFIVAGGLAVDTKPFHKEPYLTFTPAGAVELARLGLLTPVSEQVIDDKTKADPITKVVVCVQAGCHLFWFSKPYNVLSPAVITEHKVIEIAALFTLHQKDNIKKGISQMSARCVLRDELDTASIRKASFGLASEEERSQNNRPSSPPSEGLELMPTSSGQTEDAYALSGANERATKNILPPHADESNSVLDHLARSDVRYRNKLNCSTTAPDGHHSLSGDPGGLIHEPHPNKHLYPTSTNVKDQYADATLNLAQLALKRLKPLNMHFTYFTGPKNTIRHRSTYLLPFLADFRNNPGSELSSLKLRKRKSSSRFQFIFTLLPSDSWSMTIWAVLLFVSYAAFHLSAWNAHFPTTIEHWMWRGAGLGIVGVPVLLLSGALLVVFVLFAMDEVSPGVLETVGYVLVLLTIFMAFVADVLLPIIGRLYFLVEAFASLRDPGPGIYQTPEWTQFWPHG